MNLITIFLIRFLNHLIFGNTNCDEEFLFNMAVNNVDPNINTYNNVAMVFSTCDEYSCIWNGFFKLFKKYFPFWNGPIFSTVADDFYEEGYHILGNGYYGSDKSFSTRLIHTLRKIKVDNILFFLDDFYLIGPSDKNFFDNAYHEITSNKNIKHILLKDFVKHEARCEKRYNNLFHIMKKSGQYKANTQVSLYNRRYLLRLLRKGESAWDFEFFGTFRAHHKRGIVLYRDDSKHYSIPYYDAGLLHKGRLQSIYKPLLSDQNITIVEPVIAKKDKRIISATISRLYNFCYPFMSLVVPFFRRHFDGGGIHLIFIKLTI